MVNEITVSTTIWLVIHKPTIMEPTNPQTNPIDSLLSGGIVIADPITMQAAGRYSCYV